MTERLTRRAPVRANSYDPETRGFDAIISTGAPVERRDFDGSFMEVLDLDQDWPSSVPLLDSHNARSISGVVGRVTGLRTEGSELLARVKLSSRKELDGLARDIGDGIVTDLSIGYSVEKWRETTADGVRTKTAEKWKLHEASLVPIPADASAKVRKGASMAEEEDEGAGATQAQTRTARAASRRSLEALADEAGLGAEFIEECSERSLTEREARSLAFERLQARSRTAAKVSNTRHNDVTMDNPIARRDALVDAFAARCLGQNPTDAGASVLASGLRSFADAARLTLEASGQRTLGSNPAQLIERAYTTTSDFPVLLQEVGNRTLAARFALLQSPLVKLARRKTAQDFRAFSELRLGTDMRLEPVGEHGELKAGSFVESKEAMRIASYGKTYAISFEALANDDLSAFGQITSDLGTAAAQTVNDLVIGLITSNPALGDGKPVFHAAHGNILTSGSALSDASIEAAVLAMRKQRGIAGEQITVDPKILAIPPELEVAARRLLASVAAVEADKINPWSGAFTLVIEPRLSDASAWYLIDPALGDLVDAYLSGYEGPRVETRQGWNTLGSEWRVHMHYGVGFLGYRGWFKASGAAYLQTSDPCLRAEALRRALDRLLSGEAVAETELAAGNGSRRRLVYHRADVPALRQELATAERECRALGGDRSRARVVKFSTSKGL